MKPEGGPFFSCVVLETLFLDMIFLTNDKREEGKGERAGLNIDILNFDLNAIFNAPSFTRNARARLLLCFLGVLQKSCTRART